MEEVGLFKNTFKGKNVFVTGHTGFKGSWLTMWLLKLGANVTGYSIDIPTKPSFFETLDLGGKINHILGDVLDYEKLNHSLQNSKPDFVFHLAAQSIVSKSYQEPVKTFQVNSIGSANVLKSLQNLKNHCIAIMITSDKCYENVEWCWGYRETDQLGGKDPYSASKGAAELVFHSFFHSFFKNQDKIRLATARAGNVIGGGDWARDRIVADCMRAWSKGEKVVIRSPKATRPWQHVLEPLSGYLLLAKALSNDSLFHGQNFNFGPRSVLSHTVSELIEDIGKIWSGTKIAPLYSVENEVFFHEAGLLKLNCDKALFLLGWEATLNYDKTIHFTSSWYNNFYNSNKNMFDFTHEQLSEYESIAFKVGSLNGK